MLTTFKINIMQEFQLCTKVKREGGEKKRFRACLIVEVFDALNGSRIRWKF